MKGKTRIAIILITIVLVILVGLRITFSVLGSGKESKNKDNKQRFVDITVVYDEVKKGRIEKYINLAGDMRGIEEAVALPDVPGKVSKIVVKEGSYVKKDDPIMYIDRSQIGFSYNLSPVRAPISGKVGSINVTEGQFVSQTTPVASIVNDSIMEIVVLLPETYVGKVKQGDKAIIEVTTYPDEKFIGYVYSTDVIIDKSTRTLKVRVRVNNPYKKFVSGMYCNVKILSQFVDNVNYVPVTSVKNIDGENFVYVLTKLTNTEENLYIVKSRKVSVGLSDGNIVEVKGVNQGELVVSLGTEYLKDG
ncbi:MAG: efflux RND transporter periplasmic adaptor subunit, partial [Brevinematia bacterium]